jgi:hypothetical protein
VREETPVPPPRFPKTQACQTDFPPLHPQRPEAEVKEEAAAVEGRGGVWSWFRALVGSILVLLLLTLLLGGVEYEGRLYGPLPYHPLRWVQAFSPSRFSRKRIPI